jgi:hypothetical protein
MTQVVQHLPSKQKALSSKGRKGGEKERGRGKGKERYFKKVIPNHTLQNLSLNLHIKSKL